MMNKKHILVLLALCLALSFVLAVATSDVNAQTKSGDKNLATKKGLGALESEPESDEEADSKGPNKVQMAVGVGSLFVMIAVIKWL